MRIGATVYVGDVIHNAPVLTRGRVLSQLRQDVVVLLRTRQLHPRYLVDVLGCFSLLLHAEEAVQRQLPLIVPQLVVFEPYALVLVLFAPVSSNIY